MEMRRRQYLLVCSLHLYKEGRDPSMFSSGSRFAAAPIFAIFCAGGPRVVCAACRARNSAKNGTLDGLLAVHTAENEFGRVYLKGIVQRNVYVACKCIFVYLAAFSRI